MVTIVPTGPDSPVTLVNVFTVEPDRQGALVRARHRHRRHHRHLPGFVSASIHRSLDGTRVTNYAQWRSIADFEAMLGAPAAQPHLAEAAPWPTTTRTSTRW